MTPAGYHLAEFNWGILRHDWDDPRVQGFVQGLDLVNGIAAASPGFVWRLSDDDNDVAQNDVAGPMANARLASTLSVWTDVASLEHFVWNTVHRLYYARKAEWYDAIGNGNLVLWWVPVGHRPSALEGMSRWRSMADNGDTDHAFGWKYLKDAQASTSHQCAKEAAA